MKRNIFIWILTGVLILSTCGCGSRTADNTELASDIGEDAVSAPAENESSADTESSSNEPESGSSLRPPLESPSFSDFRRLEFMFSSGAGAWATRLAIKEDGSFSGEYMDSDMGDNTQEYPGGTAYQCTFSGQFTQPAKVNDYTWTMRIERIEYAHEVGTEEIKDGIRYIYRDPYGLENAEDILIYLPGAPLSELPEEFISWVGYYAYDDPENTELSFYALYNETMQYGFMSYDIVESLRDNLSYIESRTAELEDTIENDTSLSQAELNSKSNMIYKYWDVFLNSLWSALQQILDEETMEALTIEERAWIAEKEQAVEEAAALYGDGSITPLVCNRKAADMTRERVYELMEYLE